MISNDLARVDLEIDPAEELDTKLPRPRAGAAPQLAVRGRGLGLDLELEEQNGSDLSDDWATFAEAVEEELRSWDTYLERLQATAATRPWKTRKQAEAAIADLRNHRLTVDLRLGAARAAALEVWQEQRRHVETARDELAGNADELTTTLN